MKNRVILILLLMPLCLVQACHKCNDPSNPDCKNYNPCYGQLPTSANFVIHEVPDAGTRQYLLNKWVYYDTDSVLSNYVSFIADVTDAQSYEWHIGAGVYSTDSVQLNFMGVAPGTVIPITLIINKTPNTKCFPNDKGVDTVTRNMIIAPYSSHYELLGNYIGYYTDSPSKTVNFNFYLGQDSSQPQGTLITYISSNTFPNGEVSNGRGGALGMREFVYDNAIDYGIDFLFYLDSTGLATMYTQTWQQIPPTQRTFVGRKN